MRFLFLESQRDTTALSGLNSPLSGDRICFSLPGPGFDAVEQSNESKQNAKTKRLRRSARSTLDTLNLKITTKLLNENLSHSKTQSMM